MRRPKRGDVVELNVTGLSPAGRGVARVCGYAVSVRGALPGDRVLARVGRVRHGRRLIEARLDRVLHAGIPRVPPRCEHFDTCGGCLWQCIPYAEQVRLKADTVTECLRKAGIETVPAPPLPADEPYHYRNKMEFSFGTSPAGGLAIGLHVAGRFDKIFDLQSCLLQSDVSNGIVAEVRRFARDRHMSAYDLRRHTGLLRFLTVREGKRTGERMVVVTTSAEEAPELRDLGDSLRGAVPEVKSVVHSINRRKAQVAIGDEERLLSGSAEVREQLCGFEFQISPSSFFQTNTVQAERLYGCVISLADPCPGEQILDLYCGTGAISLCLSRRSGRVVGIESDHGAVRDALRNSADNAVTNCEFISGAAEATLAQLVGAGDRFDAAVVDPPRAGMHAKALAGLVGLSPGRIVYVSCNPVALGADLRELEGAGYRTDYVQLVDMFPHTPHCEIVARLHRA